MTSTKIKDIFYPEVFNVPKNASSTLVVNGLPVDCTEREVAHIFRPFQGYKSVRLIKEGD